MPSSTTRTGAAPPNGSLSKVVSSLVRAQYGLAGSTTPDNDASTDLDRHVADLLLQEAKDREDRAKRDASYSSWRWSDDEDAAGKQQQYQSKTNKRFLNKLIKGVEDYNEPLRRREDVLLVNGKAPRKTQAELDAIRQRDREQREKRKGDSTARDRSPRTEASRLDDPPIASTSSARAPAARERPLGFAAKALAMGLSDARQVRRVEDQKRQDVQDAIQDARRRASSNSHSKDQEAVRSVDKGKERERFDDHGRNSVRDRSSASINRRSRAADTVSSRDRSASPLHRESQRNDLNGIETSRSLRSNRDHDDTRRLRRRSRSDSYSSSSSDTEDETFVDYTGQNDGGSVAPSKMDKYFSQTYNPALDVSFQDLEDEKTGLIAEGNFAGWDQMLAVLKKRKEDKAFGVTRAREEDREKQLRKLERKQRREEREARRIARKVKGSDRKHKKRKRGQESGSEGDSSDTSVGPRRKLRSPSPQQPATVNIGGFDYPSSKSVREWDLGK
ncbi:hypothetical protein EMMF5_000613 [Cystobasidiomycetes sp. EMM_F5]